MPSSSLDHLGPGPTPASSGEAHVPRILAVARLPCCYLHSQVTTDVVMVGFWRLNVRSWSRPRIAMRFTTNQGVVRLKSGDLRPAARFATNLVNIQCTMGNSRRSRAFRLFTGTVLRQLSYLICQLSSSRSRSGKLKMSCSHGPKSGRRLISRSLSCEKTRA